MFISLTQIITSLGRLRDVHPFFGYAFFGFKKRQLPIGRTTNFSYRYIKKDILEKYFRIGDQSGYFNPFKSTTRWVSERYESTSLQRVIADTFADAFIHEKGSSEWGWKKNYAVVLHEIMTATNTSRIPLLDLAVWLYRNEEVSGEDWQKSIPGRLISEFHLEKSELELLFDSFTEGRTLQFSQEPVSDIDLLNHIGWQDAASERAGIVLKELRLYNVGPADKLVYQPASRINLITGDNSLGKTFLLDCAWWAMTGQWMAYAADPSFRRLRSPSEIDYRLSSGSGREEAFVAPFSPLEHEWQRPRQPLQGLALYTNFSGAFAVWDPVRVESSHFRSALAPPYLTFQPEQIWNGLTELDGSKKSIYVSNGLINDWVTWQRASDDHKKILSVFESSLRELSPPEGAHLRAGKPVRLMGDSRDIPTVRMPYGDIPILYASAGIQRILALAYMLVGTWFRHYDLARALGREPLRNIVLLVDEIESHLHPRWQRQIIPALMKAIEGLEEGLSVQLHISTHSPLVLASAEPLFNPDRDRIHHLSMENDSVKLDVLGNWKHGSVNYWLESEVFGLGEARSKPAEDVIAQAVQIQLHKSPSSNEVVRINKELVRLLPDDDPFWVRWRFFCQKFESKK
ncbi:MAG: AAA family ATPase [Xanthobacteraceae bacterium]